MGADESRKARNISVQPSVTATMETLRGAMPYVRPLLMAIIATALILIGLPAVLALGAAAAT